MLLFFLICVKSTSLKRRISNYFLSRKDSPVPEINAYLCNPLDNVKIAIEDLNSSYSNNLIRSLRKSYIEVDNPPEYQNIGNLVLEIISLPSMKIEKVNLNYLKFNNKLYVRICNTSLKKLLSNNTSFRISSTSKPESIIIEDSHLINEYTDFVLYKENKRNSGSFTESDVRIYKYNTIRNNSYIFFFKNLPLLRDKKYIKNRIIFLLSEYKDIEEDPSFTEYRDETLEILHSLIKILQYFIKGDSLVSFIDAEEGLRKRMSVLSKKDANIQCLCIIFLKLSCINDHNFYNYLMNFKEERNYLKDEFSFEFSLFIDLFEILYFLEN